MRFSTLVATVAVAASTTGVHANLLARQSNYPTCALPCVANPDLGDCVTVTDTHCLCTNKAFVSSTTTCIQNACSGQDLDDALAFSRSLCLKVGVTLTSTFASETSTAPSSSSTSGSSSSSSSSSSSASTSASGANSSPSSAALSSHGANANTLFGLFAAGLTALLAL
ncbi:hypothetical protein JR316_0012980 [Psilocybe cubensis]|uniref:Uncharacterized protein n=2 Tax=Psilocybe cubensis TaxID=181762 RepID=A0ACB8GFX6_PSICU|nr:hypothetical protein JR316_0012980 [Psilocybe cubensis]KAH9474519.1 hypothetical protein JR316_0012980 [Psilocybe cubensis]